MPERDQAPIQRLANHENAPLVSSLLGMTLDVGTGVAWVEVGPLPAMVLFGAGVLCHSAALRTLEIQTLRRSGSHGHGGDSLTE